MKIVVDVLRAEQSWDLETHEQQNYLVVEIFGIETRVPCTEDELVRALTEASGRARGGLDESLPMDENTPVSAPATFVEDSAGVPEPLADSSDEELAAAPRPLNSKRARQLAPVPRRPRGDDVGIAQG